MTHIVCLRIVNGNCAPPWGSSKQRFVVSLPVVVANMVTLVGLPMLQLSSKKIPTKQRCHRCRLHPTHNSASNNLTNSTASNSRNRACSDKEAQMVKIQTSHCGRLLAIVEMEDLKIALARELTTVEQRRRQCKLQREVAIPARRNKHISSQNKTAWTTDPRAPRGTAQQ